MSNRIEGFPPASEASGVIYHNGLEPHELETAKTLGYRCEDVRFIPGIAGIKATLLGLRTATVRMDRDQIAALRVEAEVWQKIPDELASNQSKGAQEVSSLLEGLRGNDSYAKLWKVEPQSKEAYTGLKRKRGRPKKPRPEDLKWDTVEPLLPSNSPIALTTDSLE